MSELPLLRQVCESAERLLTEMKANKYDVSVFTQKVTQTLIITDALLDIHQTMLHGLENQRFYAVDPLARVGLEHAVNLIYILKDETGQRTNALSRNFIQTTSDKSKKWLRSAREGGSASEIATAKRKLEYIEEVAEHNQELIRKGPDWPNTFERFKACGYESAYRTIYSMNSDSVHCLSEDMFNAGTVSKYPQELRATVHNKLASQNASLSIYLFAKTLSFFCIGLREISALLRNPECQAEIDKLLLTMAEILTHHEDEFLGRMLPT
ncbi:DUF5677 domain-containing protein [Duganella sp. HH105]|uniref:DUF5677 domain-containing protein n=1 Tax=Duganella sp. HH105 TaxID=1781067 RepID=UPI000877E197|nr:DUF5677 domain-containing protein [Duganella sp. HH105]OEZ62256.1 hypothetical protein DUGA6_19430 [Duganella sp. HH105]